MIVCCSLGIFSLVVVPCVMSPTRFPADVKNAFIIVTLFATSHSAIPILINILNMVSNLTSSFTSMLSEQKPITKNRTTSDEPTATNMGSRFATTAQGPPFLKLTGDCPSSSKTRDTLSFQKSTTVCKRSRITPPFGNAPSLRSSASRSVHLKTFTLFMLHLPLESQYSKY